eukprot:44926_1
MSKPKRKLSKQNNSVIPSKKRKVSKLNIKVDIYTDQTVLDLICGYCRCIAVNHMLPNEIIKICHAFIKEPNNDFMLIRAGSNTCHKMQYNSIKLISWRNTLKYGKTNIYDIKPVNKPNMFMTHDFDKYLSDNHAVPCIKLPNKMANTLNNKIASDYKDEDKDINLLNNYLSIRNNYHMLFDINGYEASNNIIKNECNLYIMESKQLYNNKNDDNSNTINAYHIPLPAYNHYGNVICNSIIYHRYRHELYSIGGEYHPRINKLDLNNNNLQWTTNYKLLHYQHSFANKLFIYNDNNSDKLMIIGGGSGDGNITGIVEIHDLDSDNVHITKMNYKRQYPGCCLLYNGCIDCKNKNICNNCRHKVDKIFVGGGYGGKKLTTDEISCQKAEIYDLNKDKWITVTRQLTHKKHKYPLIWTDVFNKNIVYIAGNSYGQHEEKKNELGCIEWIDLRENSYKRKWNIIYNPNTSMELLITDMIRLDNYDQDMWRCRSFRMM